MYPVKGQRPTTHSLGSRSGLGGFTGGSLASLALAVTQDTSNCSAALQGPHQPLAAIPRRSERFSCGGGTLSWQQETINSPGVLCSQFRPGPDIEQGIGAVSTSGWCTTIQMESLLLCTIIFLETLGVIVRLWESLS